MTITATNRPRYGRYRSRKQQSCPEGDHTRRSSGARTPGCTQSEAASGGPREELVQALPQHLKDTKHKRVSEQEAPDRAAGQLEATRATLKVQSRTSPRNPGMRWLRALLTELGERGPRWSVSKTSWRKRRRHPNRISLKMRFVHSSMRPPNHSVTSLLDAPEALKHELQMQCRRISSCSAHHH
jgi:hypothetical protein